MKTYKVDISGVTPHTVEARNKADCLRKLKRSFGAKDLKGRDISIIEWTWKPHTVDSLIKELSKFDKKAIVCIPNIGGTRHAPDIPSVKGIVEIEAVNPLFGKSTKHKAICLESSVIATNHS